MSIFSDIAANPIVASEIMEALGIDMDKLSSPKVLKQLEEVIRYLQPFDNRTEMIRRLVAGKPGVDKLDHVLEYVRLRGEYESKKLQLDATNELESTDEIKALQMIKQQQLTSLEEQIALFE